MMTSISKDFDQRLVSQQEALPLVSNTMSMHPTAVIYDPQFLVCNTAVPELLAESNQSNHNNNHNNGSESSAEEAAFPPTYATLPTTKLEEEPNPFEQSFEGATINKKRVLPSVQSMDHPTLNAIKSKSIDGNHWDSLRSGILSPSMLTGPTSTAAVYSNHTTRKPLKHGIDNTKGTKRTRQVSNSSSSEASFIVNSTSTKKSKTNSSKNSNQNDPEDEEKRKNFLERNRIAALKCRQRKKQWLQNLQIKVEYLAADNEQFYMQANALREELIQLKTVLMAHKNCPTNQQAIQAALNRPMPGVLPNNNYQGK